MGNESPLPPPPLTPFQKALWGLVLLALAAAGVGGARALRLQPLPEPLPPGDHPLEVTVQEREAVPLWEAVRVVERDPFHPERQPPRDRFLLPDDEPSSVASESPDYGSGRITLGWAPPCPPEPEGSSCVAWGMGRRESSGSGKRWVDLPYGPSPLERPSSCDRMET